MSVLSSRGLEESSLENAGTQRIVWWVADKRFYHVPSGHQRSVFPQFDDDNNAKHHLK